MRMVIENDIKSIFKTIDLNEAEAFYLSTQAIRLAYTTNLVQELCTRYHIRKVLDVGPHFLTRCIKEFVEPEISVSTLGHEYPKLVPTSIVDEHIQYDLTECMWGKPLTSRNAPFDLILYCEIIEHLFISPNLILKLFSGLLADNGGGTLMIQTPNAVALRKRISMLLGKNPFELLREDFEYKGHIREYTMNELRQYGVTQGFSIERNEFCSYWPHLSTNSVERILEALFPSLRQGITIVFRS